MKKIAILGSTGSIGTQALEIIERYPEQYCASVLSSSSRIDELREQIYQFRPEIVVTRREEDAKTLAESFSHIDFAWGKDGLVYAAKSEYDLLLNSLVGIQGLMPTYSAIQSGKDVALANKETLVSGGEIIMKTAREKGVTVFPVDSEHSAIFQCLEGNQHNPVKRIILTASGGPFRGYTAEKLKTVRLEEALKHPNWKMGSKITIDSATMMNKGLEMIEAYHLFQQEPDKIKVLVHPQSIIHSMVEFEDNGVIAQLGLPDMKLPIAYSFSYPERLELGTKSLNLAEIGNLTFEEPNMDVFRCLKLAQEALKTGGSACCVLNAANEELVKQYLDHEITFTDIPDKIQHIMEGYPTRSINEIEEILELDQEIRKLVNEI